MENLLLIIGAGIAGGIIGYGFCMIQWRPKMLLKCFKIFVDLSTEKITAAARFQATDDILLRTRYFKL